ncbi:MAG: polysaccharide deacetylase family protein [Crocinitomicaceae bacterium]
MKTTFNCLLFVLTFQLGNAQIIAESNQSGLPIEMLFPEGKKKALILSYDDGRIQDRQLVKLMNKYHLIGTFHLNGNKLGLEDYLTKEEIKELFAGHEVSAHSFNHPSLTS